MSDVVFLAWRYLAYHKLKTAVLVASIAVIVYLPVGLNILVRRSAEELTARARTTPLLVGAKGSPLQLALNSLYFESDTPTAMRYSEVARVEETGWALAIPLNTRFRTQQAKAPIVGTTLEYFEFRGLEIGEGRSLGLLGECILGSRAAKAEGAGPGDSVMSESENIVDIAADNPLKMEVVGVLKPSGMPDDLAVFVDLKTVWVIEGLSHGHQDLSRPEAADGVLRKEGQTIIANRKVMEYQEITPENVDTFHFHGDPGTFPVTAVIAVPNDEKSSLFLEGRYVNEEDPAQIIRPADVIEELLGTVFTVQRYVVVAMVIVGLATLGTIALVFILSLQLRKREMETMQKIGGSRLHIAGVVATEIVSVLMAGALLAAALSALTSLFAAAATRALILWT